MTNFSEERCVAEQLHNPPSAVRISAPPLQRAARPTSAEGDKLLAIVVKTYPVLEPRLDDVKFREQFDRALLYLVYARRQSEPNEKYFGSYWGDVCDAFCRAHGVGGPRVNLTAMTAAAVCSGVSFTALDDFPRNVSLGLTLGEANHPSTAWHDVLAAGEAPPPTKRRTPLPLGQPTVIRVTPRDEDLMPGWR